MQQHDPCRKAFEAWMASCEDVEPSLIASKRDGESHYLHKHLTLSWRAWQAAWKARGEHEDSVREKMKDWITHTTEVPNAD